MCSRDEAETFEGQFRIDGCDFRHVTRHQFSVAAGRNHGEGGSTEFLAQGRKQRANQTAITLDGADERLASTGRRSHCCMAVRTTAGVIAA